MDARNTDLVTPVQAMRLWEGDAPEARGRDVQDIPTLSVSRTHGENRAGSAVIIMPGGGYSRVAAGHEGEEVALWFSSCGVNAFVLRYRCAPQYAFPIPLLDAIRAVRLVRSGADRWGIRADQIGIVGFSAGGHLASTVGTHFDSGENDADDIIERAGSRPDFMILGYPVISMTEPYTHLETRQNLIGENPGAELIRSLSNETQVRANTPPTFLFHSVADDVVPVQNSILFHLACVKAGVPTEFHSYERGAHGLGLARNDSAIRSWPELCTAWMASHGWMRDS